MGNGKGTRNRGQIALAAAIVAGLAVPGAAEVRYVDASAGATNNGLSWATAYTDLQTALTAAAGNPAIDEIWIAEGVYTPTQGADRTATFSLLSGVIVRGGFAGDEDHPGQRRPGLFPTVLSGNIGAPGASSDNVYHVVTASGVDATGVLEGCVISGGNADGDGLDAYGGGLLVEGSGSDVTVINCRFLGNAALIAGGGVYQEACAPLFANCVFAGNVAGDRGGGALSDQGDAFFVNCTFSGNDAGVTGGGLYTTRYSGPNCWENADVHNSIFWGNTVNGQPGATAQLGFGAFACPPEFARAEPVPFILTHSCIQDWDGVLGGPTNFADDPDFLDADGADGVVGTLDDDLRLTPESPCVDEGDDAQVPTDQADLDSDGNIAEPVPFDLEHNSRIDGTAVDVGAYELAYDCNNNGINDAFDIAAGTSVDCDDNARPDECELAKRDCNNDLRLDECELAAGSATDCNNNGVLDECDIAGGLEDDCDGNGLPDACELPTHDCNNNGELDACDILEGFSVDCDGNIVPDECELAADDCNANGVLDVCDLAFGSSLDCNGTATPDECELAGNDCNVNGVPDECDVDCNTNGTPDACEVFDDCNGNDVPDECDIASGLDVDFNRNGVPDHCEADCNSNGFPDFIDVAFHLSPDCDGNGVPDECHAFLAGDCDFNGVVDADDQPLFAACFSGAICPPEGCTVPVYADACCVGADGDRDGDVDLVDFARMQAAVAALRY